MSGSASSTPTRPARVAEAQTSPSTAPLRPRLEFLMVGITPVIAVLDGECTVCTEPLTYDVVKFIKCGHVYHCVCILAWLQGSGTANRKCPVCRDVLFEAEPPSLPHSAALPIHPGGIEWPFVLADQGGGTATIRVYTIRGETRAGPNRASNNRLSGSQLDLPANMPARAASDMLPRWPRWSIDSSSKPGNWQGECCARGCSGDRSDCCAPSPPASQQSSTIPNGGPVTHLIPLLDEGRVNINAMHARIDRASPRFAATMDNMQEVSEMILNLRS